MMNSPLLSVIIPVYKVEKYLNQCIDSVINQKLDDIEIILVDDGSPDGSSQICDSYAEKGFFVNVIHKPNGGLSSARNAGIHAASGEYLIFMDSDDWWNPDVNMKEVLQTVKDNPETELFQLTSLDYFEGDGLYKRKEHYNLDKIPTDTVPNYYRGLLDNGNFEVHAATKIIRKRFLKEYNLLYKEGITSEDNEWIIRVFRELVNVKIINSPIYIYRAGRAGSITSTIGCRNICDLLSIVCESINYYKQTNVNTDIKGYELCFCSYLWFCALGLSSSLTKEEQKRLKPSFKETEAVCRYSNSKKTKLSNFCLKTLGFDLTLFILGKYISIKGKRNLNKHKVR